jgi:hypothetical protein
VERESGEKENKVHLTVKRTQGADDDEREREESRYKIYVFRRRNLKRVRLVWWYLRTHIPYHTHNIRSKSISEEHVKKMEMERVRVRELSIKQKFCVCVYENVVVEKVERRR